MSLEAKYNLKSPGVKRLMREAIELASPTEEYYACPLDDNLFEWHFTVRGPPSTEFEEGFYHGRILLPTTYPMQPPNIILLTPNGRFEINKKICLSISGHHPESWQPSWSIRTALLALIAFMPTPAQGTIGSLDYTKEERHILAKKSKNWECASCGKICDKLAMGENSPSPKLTQEESSMIESIALKAEEDANRKEPSASRLEPNSQTEPLVDGAKTDDGTPETEPRVSDVSSELRQRVVPGTSSTEDIIESTAQEITDEILQASIERSQKDKFWKTVIWVILFLIALLVIRRVFFL